MPASTTTDDEDDDVDHSTLDYKARWNNLRNIGNSPVARASIALPILGYLIVFHRDLIDYLKIHSLLRRLHRLMEIAFSLLRKLFFRDRRSRLRILLSAPDQEVCRCNRVF